MEGSPNDDSPLSPTETRVLGSLLEKEVTTPEYYPMTLNALTNACNQKSNRHPVMLLEDFAVREAADSLRARKLAMMFHGAEARVPKFKHTIENVYQLEPGERAVLCELLLRGPQTPGELRNRCERLHPFPDLDAVEQTLTSLAEYPVNPLVARLPRQPGQKEQRFIQLLSASPEIEQAGAEQPPLPRASGDAGTGNRLTALEQEVVRLKEEVGELREVMEQFRKQFE
jgi:uncharacterized protein